MLTMIAQTMLPEAYFKGGSIIGFSTLLGFVARGVRCPWLQGARKARRADWFGGTCHWQSASALWAFGRGHLRLTRGADRDPVGAYRASPEFPARETESAPGPHRARRCR